MDEPSFLTYLNAPKYSDPLPARLPVDTPASGTGNWLTAGLGAGFYGALSQGAQALRAGAKLFGADQTAQSLADYAARQHETEQSFARPDLEEHPWSPAGIAYNVARMVPMGAAAIGGGLLGAEALPAAVGTAATRGLIGASAAMFPTSAGANVQRQETETGDLTSPGKALLLGVPEAIAQGFVPARVESFFGKGIMRGIAGSAAAQGGAAGATEAMTQMMGDPDRSFADRASAITNTALSGAALGGIIGGAFGGVRALTAKPVTAVTNADLDNATKQLTYQPAMPSPLQDVPAGELAGRLDTLQREPRTQATVEEMRRLMQEQQRRSAEAAAVDAAKPPPQRLLPPPATREGPPLQDMPPTELWSRLNTVREQLALNPDDPAAQRASELLGQEFQRRSADTQLPEVSRETPVGVGAGPDVRNSVDSTQPAPVGPATVGTQPAIPELNFEAKISPKAMETAVSQLSSAPPEVQAAVRQQLVDVVNERGDKKLTGPLKRWAKELDLLTPNGKEIRDEFIKEKPIEAPPGVEDVAPDTVELPAETPVASQGPVRVEGDKAVVTTEEGAHTAELNDMINDLRAIDVPKSKYSEAISKNIKDAIARLGKMRDNKGLFDSVLSKQLNGAMFGPLDQLHAYGPGDTSQAVLDSLQRVLGKFDPIVDKYEEMLSKPVADTTPIKTKVDRAAALNGVGEAIAKLPDSETKATHLAEFETLGKLQQRVSNNPGLAKSLNARVERLKAAVVAEAQPAADQVATPDLAPSPRAEATPAPMGDLDARLTDAQKALGSLRKGLEGHPDSTAEAALAQHEAWLADIRKASTPEELRAALAADPEANVDADNLENLTQISRPQRNQINRYLAEQEGVLQELRAQSDSRARVITSRDGLPVSQLDADVTDMHRRGVSLADVANHIIEHTTDPDQAELVSKLKEFLPEGAKTIFRDGVTDKEGEYFPRQQTSALYNAADATTTAIHEMTHAVTHKALEGSGPAARAMHGIYDQLQSSENHAGITDAHEMVSEAFANPTYRAFLKSQFVKGTSLWDRFVNTIRTTLGLEPRMFNALDRVMSLGDDLMKEHQAYPNEWLGPDSYARRGNDGLATASGAGDEGERSILQRIQDNSLDVRSFLRSVGIGWQSGYQLSKNPVMNALSPNIREFVGALGKEDPRRSWMNRGAFAADRQARTLPVEVQHTLNQLMAESTVAGVHPDRSLADYPDIHNDPARVQWFDRVKDLWNQLGQTPGGQEAYKTSRAAMSNYGYMGVLHDLQAVERTVDGFPVNDVFDRLDKQTDLHNNPQRLNGVLYTELNDALTAGKAFRDNLSAERAKIDPKASKELAAQSRAMGTQIERLDAALKDAGDKQKRMLDEPYFHLGRDGDYFVTGKLVTSPDETGASRVDQRKLSQLADHLEKKNVNDVAIMQGGQHDTFYARVRNPSEAAALSRILGDAQKQGILAGEPIKFGQVLDSKVFNRVASQAMQDIVERLKANAPVPPDGASPETIKALSESHGAQIANLQRALLNMTPETSMARYMAQRQNVQGFSKDMLKSQSSIADNMASNISRQSLSHEVSAAEAGMLKDLEGANANPDVSANDRFSLADTIGELMKQQRVRQSFVPKTPIEALRNFTNVMAIGMSPAYSLMQLGQLGATGLPELAKTHGLASFGAMKRALTPAIQVVSAIARGGEGLTAGITQEALAKAELSPALTNKIMGMVARGSLGTYTRAATEYSPTASVNSPLALRIGDTALKAANTLGLYSDLIPRIVMGLAADDLYTAKPHREMTREQFIDNAINESQGYWGSALGARNTSRAGWFGAATPLFTQFSQWNIHMTNKIYREVAAAVGSDKQSRAEAQTWLAGHAAAVTMLAGTLGLPALSVAASIYDRLADWATGSDNHDVTAAYRNFLASTFGKDMGEVIARGLPRAAGVDFAHWGEGEIIPGSSSINTFFEKRKFDDMKSDWFKGFGGPALNKMFQLSQGAGAMLNGDYLDGMIQLMPGLVSGPLKAYKLTDEGFTDRQGQKLPISGPSTWQIMQTVLGITPGKLAEYQEVAREASGLRAMREARSADIGQHLRQAYIQHDPAALRTWMGEAQRWQADHPGLVPPQASFARSLMQHQQSVAQARGLGLPIGVQPQDLGTRRQLGYGNLQ